jgi:hypothetical protein
MTEQQLPKHLVGSLTAAILTAHASAIQPGEARRIAITAIAHLTAKGLLGPPTTAPQSRPEPIRR